MTVARLSLCCIR